MGLRAGKHDYTIMFWIFCVLPMAIHPFPMRMKVAKPEFFTVPVNIMQFPTKYVLVNLAPNSHVGGKNPYHS